MQSVAVARPAPRFPLLRRRLLPFLLMALAIGLDVVATAALARAMGTANDLFPRWYGTHAWLVDGRDPYSQAVSDAIRDAMGGVPGEPTSAFVFGFVYPAYVALLLTPLALVPFEHAATIWLLLAQLGVGLGTFFCWRAAERESALPAGSAAGAIAMAVLFPASLFNLLFGQFAALVFAAVAASWYLVSRGSVCVAGAVLALALVKPSVALLPATTLLTRALYRRDWRFVLAWASATAVLLAASLAAIPTWPASFWGSTVDYARVASATSAAGLAATVVASLAGNAGVADVTALRPGLTALFGLFAGLAVLAGWRRSARTTGDALAAGVLLGAWLVPPLYEWNSVLLLVPLVLWVRRCSPHPLPGAGPLPSEHSPAFPTREGGTRGRRLAAHLRMARPYLVLASAAAVTIVAVVRWPSESRLIWPSLVLGGWVLQRRTVVAVLPRRVEGDAAGGYVAVGPERDVAAL